MSIQVAIKSINVFNLNNTILYFFQYGTFYHAVTVFGIVLSTGTYPFPKIFIYKESLEILLEIKYIN